jgi:hypothetical protein
MRAAAAERSGSIYGCAKRQPQETGLKDALVGDQAGRSGNHASFGPQSEGPGDGSRYQNFLDGIQLSGRNVHQITYNFQRPRFALEIVGTS